MSEPGDEDYYQGEGDFHERVDDVGEDIPFIDIGSGYREQQRDAERAGERAEDILRGPRSGGIYYYRGDRVDSGTYRPLDEYMRDVGQMEDPYREGLGADEVSAASGFRADPALVAANDRALAQLERIASGQQSVEDLAAEQVARGQLREDDLRARQTALQGMEEQGLGGVGGYAAAVGGAQARSAQQYDLGLDMAAERDRRAGQARQLQGQLSSSMREQEFGESQRRGSAVDDFNEWQRTYLRGSEQRNTDRLNRRREVLADAELGRAAAFDRNAQAQRSRDAERTAAAFQAAGSFSSSGGGDDDDNDNRFGSGGTYG
jgi:hypothetical protein